MRSRLGVVLAGVFIAFALTACGEEKKAEAVPPPAEPGGESVAYFCNMGVFDHGGPKGQVFLKGRSGEPIWFSSVRDTFAFTLLPEEPKNILVIYVSDMAKAKNWERPTEWIEAHKAWYVIGSTYDAGMGGKEAVPFSDEAAARRFAEERGGAVVRFNEMPENYILETDPVPVTRRMPRDDTERQEEPQH